MTMKRKNLEETLKKEKGKNKNVRKKRKEPLSLSDSEVKSLEKSNLMNCSLGNRDKGEDRVGKGEGTN